MKAQHAKNNRHREFAGSALLMTIILALCLGLVLGSYLYLTGTQTNLVAESQAWNASLAYAEAGIEEGFAQLNVNEGKFGLLLSGPQATTNYFASLVSNFGNASSGIYGPKTTSLGNGAYSVAISNDFPPTLYSTGSNEVVSIGRSVSRTVQVKTSIKPLFGNAIAALQNLNGNGNTVLVDSYDSTDLTHFTNGLYNSTWAMATADVALPGGALGLGNADIYGHLLLGPQVSASAGPNARVGDLFPGNAWGTPGWSAANGIEPGWEINDFNMDFPDVVAPYSSGLDPTGTGSGTNDYVLGPYQYYVSGDFPWKNQQQIYVSGDASLYVTGSFNQKPNDTIVIGPGGMLRLYVGAASGASTSLTLYTVNNTGNALNFQVYALPTTTSVGMNGNNVNFIGTVYAPEAALNFGGSGVYQGSIVSQSITLSGNISLHYDQNLKKNGPASGFTLAYWTEL